MTCRVQFPRDEVNLSCEQTMMRVWDPDGVVAPVANRYGNRRSILWIDETINKSIQTRNECGLSRRDYELGRSVKVSIRTSKIDVDR